MKIKCIVEFEFETSDSLEETLEYLKNCPHEALEWMPDDVKFTFSEAE